jgi:Ca-activated chloride channel family protein
MIMAKNDFDEFDMLRGQSAPKPSDAARRRALDAALRSFEDADEKSSIATQGLTSEVRLIARTRTFWREIMQKKLIANPVAVAGLVALPVAGLVTWQMMDDIGFGRGEDASNDAIVETTASQPQRNAEPAADAERAVSDMVAPASPVGPSSSTAQLAQEQAGQTGGADLKLMQPGIASRQLPMAAPSPKMLGMPPAIVAEPTVPRQDRDRVEAFDTNPVRLAVENPVSTFSIDVDTASYAFVRRSLKEGVMPQSDSVRVEEMINYFLYDWTGPETASVPFNSTITVMPTPWNENTQLMHLAIKGYDVAPAENPRSNLVFLIDTSGSMHEADKLPLLKNSFRLLVERLGAEDTVSIVAYAGNAGTVLEPTRASDKAAILSALDRLEAGGSTAGEAGLREAYRLAQSSFVEGGVNRVMLATDGDFNVGQTSDEDLRKLIEDKRESGVYLTVLGFGRGNLNDRMMQTIAQQGNGTAAYIDTLAEAEKVLVQESSSTLFPIANDVKIQIEFNPERIAEYRLIGYETRALAREDFNNDRVDAGDIGSGHSVTAIYEITPVGSSARMIDDLRYGPTPTQATPDEGELAFVKIRYKAPGEDVSKLIETPVTSANVIASLDAAGEDQRFSVAVAAFGQKLRGTDALASYGYDRVVEIAMAARGSDPFGYRAEFLSLVRLAAALDSQKR